MYLCLGPFAFVGRFGYFEISRQILFGGGQSFRPAFVKCPAGGTPRVMPVMLVLQRPEEVHVEAGWAAGTGQPDRAAVLPDGFEFAAVTT